MYGREEVRRLGLAPIEQGRPYRHHDATTVDFDEKAHGVCSREGCDADLETLDEVWQLDGEGFCSDLCCGEHAHNEYAVRLTEGDA